MSGVFRRVREEVNRGEKEDKEVYTECKETVDNLVSFMHYQIFKERAIRGLTSDIAAVSSMILGMFMRLKIDHTELQCLGKCGQTFPKDDVMLRERETKGDDCPKCAGELVKAPPILKLDNVRFLYPADSEKHLENAEEGTLLTARYIGFISGVMVPRNLSLIVNRLSPKHFGNLISVPSKIVFTSKDYKDYFQISINYRTEKDIVNLFLSVSDTRFNTPELREIFVPAISVTTVNRDIIEGVQKGFTIPKIVKKSILSNWSLSKEIKTKNIGDYEKYTQIPLEEGWN